jgi:hypothetical protein
MYLLTVAVVVLLALYGLYDSRLYTTLQYDICWVRASFEEAIEGPLSDHNEAISFATHRLFGGKVFRDESTGKTFNLITHRSITVRTDLSAERESFSIRRVPSWDFPEGNDNFTRVFPRDMPTHTQIDALAILRSGSLNKEFNLPSKEDSHDN